MLCHTLASSKSQGAPVSAYLQRKIGTITQMYPFEATVARRIMFPMGDITLSVPSRPQAHIGLGERLNAQVGDAGALDEPDPLQLGQSGKPRDRVICQVCAAAEVDVPDAVAVVDEALHGLVGEMPAVAKVDIVQILAQPRDGEDGGVRDIPAFGEHEVAEARGNVDDLLDGTVGKAGAGREVQDAEVFVRLVRRQRQEGAVVYEFAVGESQFTERATLGKKSGYRIVLDKPALMKIDLEDVGAMLGKGKDGLVGQLMTVVQF